MRENAIKNHLKYFNKSHRLQKSNQKFHVISFGRYCHFLMEIFITFETNGSFICAAALEKQSPSQQMKIQSVYLELSKPMSLTNTALTTSANIC